MTKMCIQFHAIETDFFEFITNLINNKYYIKGVVLFPKFKILTIDKSIDIKEIKNIDMIFISKDEIESKDDYNDFIEEQDNRIGIDIGIKNDGLVRESRMWIITENTIDSDLKQIYNKFKKKLLKGAWGISSYPNGKKVFYKNHLYTMNAKEANENGIEMYALAGTTIYELNNDSDRY